MLRRISIKMRLCLAFGLMQALILELGVGGWYATRMMNSTFETFSSDVIPSMRDVDVLHAGILEARVAEKDMLLAGSGVTDFAKARERWDAALARADKSLLGIEGRSSGAEVKDAVSGIRRSLGEYRSSLRPVIDEFGKSTAGADLAGAWRATEPAARFGAEAEQRLVKASAQVEAAVKAAREDADKIYNIISIVIWTVMVSGTAVAGVVAMRIAKSVLEPIDDSIRFATAVESGSLDEPLQTEGKDEMNRLAQSLLQMQTGLRSIVGRVRDGAESIEVAASEVALGNQDLSARTENAAASLQQTASSMEQLTENVRHNADAARQANQLAENASQVATRGGQVVAQVVSTMDEISASSHKISEIIGTIDGIAFQTNILALNAAVEAARAGEQGRGFAVVAGEVRQLAKRSAEAAREIKGLITASVQRIDAGAALVSQAGSTMDEIVGSVQRVTDIMSEITASTSDQSNSIFEVGQAISTLDQMTQQNAALVEQSAAAASSLKDQAKGLSEAISSFRLSHS